MVADPSPSVRLARLLDGYLTTQLLHTAARLRLDEILRDGAKSAAAVAAEAGADPRLTTQVLRGLVSVEVLAEDAGGRFLLTPIGAALGPMRSAALVRGELYYAAAAALPDSVLAGDVAFHRTYGTGFFDHLETHPDIAATFQQAMGERSRGEVRDVLDAYDFSGLQTLVDVGGGQGTLIAEVVRSVPGLTGTLVDQAVAVEAARRMLQTAGLADRIECVVADFFDALPPDRDAYLLSRVLHDWNDADARRILRCCRRAVPDHGRLLVVDAVLPDRVSEAPDAIRMDLHMGVLFGACERTEAELEALLRDSGFLLQRIILTPSPARLAVVEAVPG